MKVSRIPDDGSYKPKGELIASSDPVRPTYTYKVLSGKDIPGAQWPPVDCLGEEAANALSDAWDATKEVAEEAWDATTDAAEEAWDATTDAAEEAWDATTDAAEEAWDATTDAVEDAWDATKEVAEDTWDATKDAAGDTAKKARKMLNQVYNLFD